MPINTVTVGPYQVPVELIGDPTNANGFASVLTLADAKNLAGLYALLVQNVPVLLNTGGTYDRARSAPGTTGIPSVNTEGTKATYAAGLIDFTPAATATDFWSITGSGSKIVRVTRLTISGIATSATSVDIQLIKRLSANSSGSPTAITASQYDSNDGAATATVVSYGANPTLGSTPTLVRTQKLNLGATGAAGSIVWDFTTRNSKGLVLRSATEVYSLNWNGAAVPSGTSLDVDVEWTEE